MTTHEPDDDQHWLSLMAGRAAPQADARTRKEAAWFRAALLSYRLDAPPGAPAAANDRIARLLTRARDSGVLPAAANEANEAGAAAGSRAWRWRHALAAGVAGFGILLTWPPQRLPGDDPQGEGSALRGGPLQRIEAVNALQRREQLLLSLRSAGFDAQPFERLGRPGIDIALPVPLPPAQAEALKRLGLAPPAGPSLQIEFITPPAPARP